MRWARYLPPQPSVRALRALIDDPAAKARLEIEVEGGESRIEEARRAVAEAEEALETVRRVETARLKIKVIEALEEAIRKPRLPSDELLVVLNTACEVWSVNLKELMAPTRQSKDVVACRTAVVHYLYYDCGQSITDVSEQLMREASTVRHLLRRSLVSEDERYKELRQLMRSSP